MILIEVKPTKNVNKNHQSFQKEVLPSRILIENAVYIWAKNCLLQRNPTISIGNKNKMTLQNTCFVY